VNEYIVIAAISFFLIAVLIFVYIKDAEASRKFFLYEKAIEDLNKKIYKLEKRLNEYEKNYSVDDMGELIEQRVKSDLQNITNLLMESHNEVNDKVKKLSNELHGRVDVIEEKIKQYSSLPDTYQSNDKRVVSLYNDGLTVSEIAKNLRMGIGEVELVLKIAGLK
jgi:DNA repair exonuclease SbcCD ATPase subunit